MNQRSSRGPIQWDQAPPNPFRAADFVPSADRPAAAAPARPPKTPWIALAAGWLLLVVAALPAIGLWVLPSVPLHHELRLAGQGESSENIAGMCLGVLWTSMAACGLASHVRKRTQRRRGVALGRLAGVAVVATIGGLLRPVWDETAGSKCRAALAAADQRGATALAAVLNDAADGDLVIDADDARFNELAEADRRVGEYLREVARLGKSIRDDYDRAVEHARLGAMLLPARLDSRSEVLDSRERLATLRGALDRFDRAVGDLPRQYELLVARYFDHESDRADALRSLMNGFDFVLESAANERAVIDEMDYLLGVMLECQGRFTFESGLFYFADEWDSYRFDMATARIDAIGRIELDRHEQQRDRVRLLADQLETGAEIGTRPGETRIAVDCEIGAEGTRLGGLALGPATTTDDLVAHLGSPDRPSEDGSGILLWHDTGVIAHVEGQTVTCIGLVLHADTTIPDMPRQSYSGRLTVLDQRVTGIDTVLSVNRRLEGEPLLPLDETGMEWGMALGDLETGMVSRPDGLLFLVWIALNPASEPETVSDAAPLAALPTVDTSTN